MTPPGIEPETFRFVAQHLNHWATAVPRAGVFKTIYQSTALPLSPYHCLYRVPTRWFICMGSDGGTRNIKPSTNTFSVVLTNRNKRQTKCLKYTVTDIEICDKWRIKNQLDATCYFIALLIGSTCFEHYHAHHQELATMMFITTLVASFLVCCTLEVRCS